MIEVKCSRCKEMKPETASNGYCRECNRDYAQQYRTANAERCRATNRACAARRYDKNRDLLLAYLELHPCVDCGEPDPIVLEFDHVDPKTKRSKIANVLGSWNWETILNEIAKCQVRCANCHRRRTAKQFGWYKGGDANDRELGISRVD